MKNKTSKSLLWGWKNSLGLSLLSILLFTFSFETIWPFSLPLLGWVAVVPWILMIRYNSLRGALGWSAFITVGAYGIVMHWIVIVTPGGFFASMVIMSLYLMLFAGLTWWTYQRYPHWASVALPFFWISVQFLRSNLFFFKFPWYLLGYSQFDQNWVIQTADIWGTYGVSMVMIIVNSVVAEGVYHFRYSDESALPRPGLGLAIVAAALLIFCPLYSHYRVQSLDIKEGPKIAVIQGNVPQTLKVSSKEKSLDQIQDEYMALTKKAWKQEKFDLGLWPETMLTPREAYVMEVRRWIYKNKVPMLIGTIIIKSAPKKSNQKYILTNSAVLFNKKAKMESRYDKVFLVPLGEYIPFRETVPPIANFFRSLLPPGFESMTHGKGVVIMEVGGFKFAPDICFEISFPQHMRESVQKGAQALISISNDAWFQDSVQLENTRSLGVVRAIETRRGVIRAVNAGISSFIDPDGSAVDIEDKNGKRKEVEGILIRKVRTTELTTLYVLWGDYLAYLSMMLSVFWIGLLVFGSKKEVSDEVRKEDESGEDETG